MRRGISLMDGQIENDGGIGWCGQPAVMADFAFQLARTPSGIADTYQHSFRTCSGCDGFENIA